MPWRGDKGDVVRSVDQVQARPLRQALCLHMGQWHPSAGASGRRSAVHSRHHRRDTGRHEGTGRLHRRQPRKCARLARAAARSQASWAHHRTGTGGRRRCARLLEGARRGLAESPRAAMLGSQDCKRAGQVAEEPTPEWVITMGGVPLNGEQKSRIDGSGIILGGGRSGTTGKTVPADHGFARTRLNATLRTVTMDHLGNVGSQDVGAVDEAAPCAAAYCSAFSLCH